MFNTHKWFITLSYLMIWCSTFSNVAHKKAMQHPAHTFKLWTDRVASVSGRLDPLGGSIVHGDAPPDAWWMDLIIQASWVIPIPSVMGSVTIDFHWWHCRWRLPLPLPFSLFIPLNDSIAFAVDLEIDYHFQDIFFFLVPMFLRRIAIKGGFNL